MSELVHVPFNGENLLLVDVNGKPYVVLRPALEAIGLHVATQMEKLRKRSWATVRSERTVASDGKVRDMTVCDVRTFLMLLATIDENLVSPNVQPKLIAYQAEVADVIDSYWNGTYATSKAYVLAQANKWEHMFDSWLKSEAVRLKIPYPTLIRKYAYERFLPKGVIEEIDKKNPVKYYYFNGSGGNRRYRQHQFLTDIKGRPELRERLNGFKTIAQTCTDKAELDRFMATYDRNNTPSITAQ